MKRKPVFNLDAYERRIEAELEGGEWKRLPKKEEARLKAEMVAAARRYLKIARVNLRLNGQDLAIIREKAQQEGIPYQTLIASVLHKYATDQLVDEKMLHRVIGRLRAAEPARRRVSS